MTKSLLDRLNEDDESALGEVESPIQEGNFKVHEVESIARQSLDFLAGLAMPHIFRYFFPELYRQAWIWLLSFVNQPRTFPQLALGLPRGFAKTTFVKIFLLFVILFTDRKFVAVCAKTEKKAINIVSDVIDFLNELNIKKIFGDWKMGDVDSDSQTKKVFAFRGRTISFWAGTVATIRGINLKHERPDIMLFDDIQDRDDADSEVISNQIETDMIGTAMKAKSPHGCMFLFVGNMYPTKHSILKHLKTNANWFKFIVGGILANGQSLWEDLQPIKQLIQEYENDLAMGKPEIFFAEVLNDETASVNNLINLQKIPNYIIPDDEIHQGNFVIIDPATDKANADAVSIMYFEIHGGYPVCKELSEGSYSPGKTIKVALDICLRKNCRVVGIEGTAYQATLCYWFGFICLQYGIIGIEAVEILSGRYSKNSRILTMFKALLEGEIKIHPDCMPAIALQVTGFNPMKTNNTDGLLDCLAYAPKMIEMYGGLILSSMVIEEQNNGSIRIHDVLENSPF